MATITNRQAAALEKLFDAELPTESGEPGPGFVCLTKAEADLLLPAALAVEVEAEISGGGLPSVKVRGHAVTPRGHYAYCAWARENCREEV